jgi:N-acetylated-alpha-linked acidic dipeptidase
VFANWDGEEPLLGGSTQWVKDNAEKLRSGAITYINVDSAVQGRDFVAGSTPALARFVREVSRTVEDPDSGRPLHDAWAARFKDDVPEVVTIVGATDYTAFQEHLGISCIDMYFDGPYGVYHSQYDNYFRQERIVDPGFRYGTALAKLWGVMAWRLADAPLLPMRYSDYARAAVGYIEAAEAHAPAARGLRLEAARAAATRWEQAAAEFEAQADGAKALPADLRAVNDLLLQVERTLTEPAGLQGRPFVKHLLVAPQPSYRSEYLPRVWEAIDRGDWAAVPVHEAEIVAAFDRAAGMLQRAAELLQKGAVPAA